jgi:hypothetical protein
MKYRVFAVIVLGVLVLNLGGSTFADTKARKTNSGQLVSMLPASDGVVTFDVKRFFVDALPQVLASNQPMLANVTGKLDEIETKLGIDVREFDDVAVGVAVKQLAVKKYDVDPVVIARGQTNSAALIGAAKLASKSKYREQRIGDRVMYIFDMKSAGVAQPGAKVLDEMTEVAVTSLDDRTIAFGDVARVRQTLEAKTRVGADLVGMLERSPSSVASFAAKPPEGLKAFLPLENDELGKNIDSIKYLYGSANVAAGTATIQVTARTLQNAQATSLYETLNGLQMLGKAFLGGSQSGNRVVYSRLIDSAKFSVKANEVLFEISVPQSDIDILVGMLK